MWIKPARPEVKVRDPISRLHLPDEGKSVADDDTYWVRRLLDGDVVKVETQPAAAPAATEKKKGKE